MARSSGDYLRACTLEMQRLPNKMNTLLAQGQTGPTSVRDLFCHPRIELCCGTYRLMKRGTCARSTCVQHWSREASRRQLFTRLSCVCAFPSVCCSAVIPLTVATNGPLEKKPHDTTYKPGTTAISDVAPFAHCKEHTVGMTQWRLSETKRLKSVFHGVLAMCSGSGRNTGPNNSRCSYGSLNGRKGVACARKCNSSFLLQQSG